MRTMLYTHGQHPAAVGHMKVFMVSMHGMCIMITAMVSIYVSQPLVRAIIQSIKQ